MDEIIDLLDIAAKNYPIKALAVEIGKAESTLRNELTQQPGYKLGLQTALLIMKRTGDLRALDKIEEAFDRVAFRLPKAEPNDMSELMKLIAGGTREFGEHMAAMADAMEDGKITRAEAVGCLKELRDVMAELVKLRAYLKQFVTRR